MANLAFSRYAYLYKSIRNGAHGKKMADPTTLSEDCLTISVFRPAGVSSKEKLPVVSLTVLDKNEVH